MTVLTPLRAEFPALEEARSVHARWSELNGAFLDAAAAHPEYLARDTFASLSAQPWLRAISLQSWPFFLGVEQRREVERVAVGMDRLMKGAVERFLRGDVARVRDFYRFRETADGRTPRMAIFKGASTLATILEEPDGLRSAPSRADFLEDADGLKCLEFNAGGFLGATQLDGIGGVYLACPAIARFLQATGRRARAPDTLAAQFRHLVAETVRVGAWSEGEFNAAVVARPSRDEWAAMFVEEMYTGALRRVLEERGIPGGRAFVCSADDLVEEGGSLSVAGRPVHLVMEHHNGSVTLRLPFRLAKMRRIHYVSGPIGHLLSDKANLALISEHARSDEFTARERAFIQRHVPWTRRVRRARTDFRGRGLRLPDDLAERRAEFVLKKSSSMGGRDVFVGRFRTDAEWRGDLTRAVWEEDWIVQEYLETVPYCFQAGEHGAVRQDMVWGLFVFGNRLGGALTRMMPRAVEGGVVNAAQGAQLGVCLELDD